MTAKQYEIGMIGLGVMGRNFALNMADHGFSVVGYDTDKAKVEALRQEAGSLEIQGVVDIKGFVEALRMPRAVMLLVPAGAPVDTVISELTGLLQPGDLIIDGGNSYFKDTDLRALKLKEKGIYFLGVGISGGEEGARHGPSIMPGGPKEAYERVRLIFEAVSAKVSQDPCAAWIGPESSGHFVKMVHNGIEYGLMQLIAESYDLMKRGLDLSDEELSKVYASWNEGELNGYLIEITSRIFSREDKLTHQPLIDEILGVAKQKGTGMWTTQSAMDLQVPIPTIDIAVAMRDLSVFVQEREQASTTYPRPSRRLPCERETFLKQLRSALYTAIMITYAQGMALLVVASAKHNYQINFETVARIWRGGCIIRSSLLEDFRVAFNTKGDLSNLLLDKNVAAKVLERQESLRQVICQAARVGLPLPAFMASLSYLDAYSSPWQPANLIQAQRDYFGSHTYEMIDTKGSFHLEWNKG